MSRQGVALVVLMAACGTARPPARPAESVSWKTIEGSKGAVDAIRVASEGAPGTPVLFIGATWSREMRNMMLISLASYIAAYYLLFPHLQNHGLWLALQIFFGMRGLTLSYVCRRKADSTFAKTG